MKLNISPDPAHCINKPGGVNSVISDHTAGLLAIGHELAQDGLNIVHALATHKDIDVFHCHGLYPIGSGYFPSHYSRYNEILLDNALKAKVTLCVSEFSANLLRHKLHIAPKVIRNGIWIDDYQAGGNPFGSILFPKIDLNPVCTPDDMLYLKEYSDFRLLSIADIPGITSTGKLSRSEFLKVLSSSSIYLATTKENSSMGTMEAMAMGIPVVGYDYGFNSEYLVDGVGCRLVPPQEKKLLKEAISEVLGSWMTFSRKAREFARIFDWKPQIEELSKIYESIEKGTKDPSVSIIIPCFNYSRWVGEAVESALKQTKNCEIIVINDNSTDNSLEIIKRYPVSVLNNRENLGVANSRNKAIEQASGDFIICLDADDRLHPTYVETVLKGFTDEKVAISFTPIRIIDENSQVKGKNMFQQYPTYDKHIIGQNQVPSCCMFRKIWWQRAGGYEQRYNGTEDANLWLKIMNLGGQAVRVSHTALMDYRSHSGSLSRTSAPTWWEDHTNHYTSPIEDREIEDFLIVIDGYNERVKETLWSLENQTHKRWTCLLQTPNGLSKTFPWLNRPISRKPKTTLHVKAGQVLEKEYLAKLLQNLPNLM